ncbi:heavy metal translocating P-type ATPase metal-binding domain-containing protein [Magnetospirillum gryphiswaldense]|uniref:heavy metal translocating P-type ATPase metal-binding domain-containing protein n=1 Tax=Magnetospirillum gryphiswaldense TaxID=55518 RepID=UPI000321ACDE|nr:heavy metal translocating P-type ATPase metal-binding domain-containing protein [Magnetospirillum gryphiswaldense]AVM75884.1 putative copper-importing P-type ATPase A [Magnetospirillum gryphiswaldense MSR-1]AVM79787.1 putative copper-importing P-type ATPase A [Magnetospirillum gryphiswaldense]
MSTRPCRHCGQDIPVTLDGDFCCRGCEGAYALVQDMGLERYYQRRSVDPALRPLRPEDGATAHHDYAAHVVEDGQGGASLNLMVEGIHCAACIWLIEAVLARHPAVTWARVNMTTRRLVLRWKADQGDAADILAPVLAVGYRLVPFDPAKLGRETEKHEKQLLRAMAVAGFAAGNVMLLSVSVWAGHFSHMGAHTRDLMHWISALIVLPAVLYCIRPFLYSALAALSNKRTNMDVPISLGVLLASGMSLAETIRGGEHAYFDSAITLLFFLLIGRYLDSRARGRARSAAEHLLTLDAVAVSVLEDDGSQRLCPPNQVKTGQIVLVAAGERIGVDGTIVQGRSDVDTSLITGESVPAAVDVGGRVFAGTINLSAPLRLQVAAVGERTLLAEIVRMMEVAEQGRAKYVALADRVARWYAPVVHVAALSTFLGWVVLGGIPWQVALLHAVAVLIITCPCALALAVPVVQVIASGRLLRQGILLKSATALERVAEIDVVVFDKTGTLTVGKPELLQDGAWTADDLRLAASLAVSSHHPLARALAAAAPAVAPLADAIEEPGRGMVAGAWRLGSRAHVGMDDDEAVSGPELWLAGPGRAPLRFGFADRPRDDAAQVLSALRGRGLRIELLSGDRAPTVRQLAERLGIDQWQAGCTPAAKVARLEELKAQGQRVMMVGDGLNDAPALSAAHVSLSPSSAVDVSQTAADVVFQGERLGPVAEICEVAARSRRLVSQNFALALGYNVFTVPLAVAGHVTPLIAAIAMSTSSLVVIGNALRLTRGRKG